MSEILANILSGISILEIMDLVPLISITRNKLHANNVQLFTSPAYDYLWPPTSYLNLLSRLVYFLAPFKEMKTLNCPTNTPFTLRIVYLLSQFLKLWTLFPSFQSQEISYMPTMFNFSPVQPMTICDLPQVIWTFYLDWFIF